MSTPSNFENLPAEVLHLIVQKFHIEIPASNSFPQINPDLIDTAALHSLSLTSCRTHVASLPVLYHSLPFFDITCEYKTEDTTMMTAGAWRRKVELFVRTITERPGLAKFVRTASFNDTIIPMLGETGAFEKLMATASAINPEFITALASIMQEHTNLQFSISQHVQNIPDKGFTNPTGFGPWIIGNSMIATLLAILPNLTTLILPRRGPCTYSRLLGALGVQPQTKSLTTRLNLGPIVPFLNIFSRLENLHLNFMRLESIPGSISHTQTAWEALLAMPHLKHLRLSGVLIHKSWFNHILTKCTGSLETFALSKTRAAEDWDQRTARTGFSIVAESDVLQALAPHCDSIRSLELYMAPTGGWSLKGPGLDCFKCLETLSLTIACPWQAGMAFWTSLPRSIRHLQVMAEKDTGCGTKLLDRLKIVAEEQLQNPKPYPYLERVECTIGNEDVDLVDLYAAFASANIILITEQRS